MKHCGTHTYRDNRTITDNMDTFTYNNSHIKNASCLLTNRLTCCVVRVHKTACFGKSGTCSNIMNSAEPEDSGFNIWSRLSTSSGWVSEYFGKLSPRETSTQTRAFRSRSGGLQNCPLPIVPSKCPSQRDVIMARFSRIPAEYLYYPLKDLVPFQSTPEISRIVHIMSAKWTFRWWLLNLASWSKVLLQTSHWNLILSCILCLCRLTQCACEKNSPHISHWYCFDRARPGFLALSSGYWSLRPTSWNITKRTSP